MGGPAPPPQSLKRRKTSTASRWPLLASPPLPSHVPAPPTPSLPLTDPGVSVARPPTSSQSADIHAPLHPGRPGLPHLPAGRTHTQAGARARGEGGGFAVNSLLLLGLSPKQLAPRGPGGGWDLAPAWGSAPVARGARARASPHSPPSAGLGGRGTGSTPFTAWGQCGSRPPGTKQPGGCSFVEGEKPGTQSWAGARTTLAWALGTGHLSVPDAPRGSACTLPPAHWLCPSRSPSPPGVWHLRGHVCVRGMVGGLRA